MGNANGEFEGRDALAECMREGYKDRARKVLDESLRSTHASAIGASK